MLFVMGVSSYPASPGMVMLCQKMLVANEPCQCAHASAKEGDGGRWEVGGDGWLHPRNPPACSLVQPEP